MVLASIVDTVEYAWWIVIGTIDELPPDVSDSTGASLDLKGRVEALSANWFWLR